MFRYGVRVGSGLLVSLAAWLLSSGTAESGDGLDGKPLLPAAEFTALVKQDAKVIEEILGKGTPDKKGGRRVKLAAFMIAAYAQANSTKADSARMAAVHEAALKLLKELEAGKRKEALALAQAIPTLKEGTQSVIKPLALKEALDFSEVMHQFSGERVGGFGIEKELNDLAEAQWTPAQLEQAGTLGYKLAVVGHLSLDYRGDKEEGGMKTVKNWIEQSTQFRQAALGLATAARSKNAAATQAALEKVSGSCTKCHDIFR